MNNNWQNKIYDHKVAPPKGIWDSIAKELDKEDEKSNVTSKDSKAKIISFNYRRLAVAASIIAVLSLSGYWFLQNQRVAENNIAKENSNKENNQTINSGTDKQLAVSTDKKAATTNTIINNPGIQNNTRGSEVAKEIKTTSNPGNNNLQTQSLEYYTETAVAKNITSNPALKIEKLVTPGGEAVDDMSKLDAPQDYVSIIGPDGQRVRVSAKFSSIAPLFRDSEEYIDIVIKEAGKWKLKLKEWKSKMTYNNLTPSPTNFMDIIELSEVLNEK